MAGRAGYGARIDLMDKGTGKHWSADLQPRNQDSWCQLLPRFSGE